MIATAACLALGASLIPLGGTAAFSAAAKPPVPASVKLTEKNYESFRISWKKSANATSYNVKIASDAKFTRNVATFGTRSTSYKPIKLKNCVSYYYKVLANNGLKAKSGYSKAKKVTLNCFWPGKFSTITAKPKSSSSIELSWKRPTNATRFVVWRSADKYFKSGVKKFSTSGTKLLDKSLPSGRPYYYRIYAFNRGNTVNVRQAPRVEGNVAAAKMGGLRISKTSAKGATVNWTKDPNASRYEVRVAGNSAFTSEAVTYATVGNVNRLKINSLKPGKKYYFKVRALNGASQNIVRGAYSPAVSATTRHEALSINAMSFNVGTANTKSTTPKSQLWSSRRDAVVNTVAKADADLLGTQEAYASYDYPGSNGLPQWEDLRRRLAKQGYARALSGTDGKYTYAQAGVTNSYRDEYLLDGNHIFYKTAVMRTIGKGGKFKLPNPDKRASGYAASWQVFETKDAAKQKFLAVNTHLYAKGIDATNGKDDKLRTAQVVDLLAQLKAKLAKDPMPVVVTGDMNSHGNHLAIAKMEAAGYFSAEAKDVPKVKANFNSSHGYSIKPPNTYGTKIDYVFTSGQIAVRKWELVADINPSTGKFRGVIPSDHHPIKARVTLAK